MVAIYKESSVKQIDFWTFEIATTSSISMSSRAWFNLDEEVSSMLNPKDSNYLVILSSTKVTVLSYLDYMSSATVKTITHNVIDFSSSGNLVDMKGLHANNLFCILDQTNFKIQIYNFIDSAYYYEYEVNSSYSDLSTVTISGDDNYIIFTTKQNEEIKLLKSANVASSSAETPQDSDSDENSSEGENPQTSNDTQYPESSDTTKESGETEENLGEHQPSEKKDYFSNPVTKYAINTVVIGSFVGVGLSGAAANSCPNFGVALVKMLQLIEILGKFLYIPVIYKGLLLDGLSGINDIGDAVTLPENIFLDKVDESVSTKGKITVYSTSSYILKTIPLTTLQVIILLLFKLFFNLLGKSNNVIKKVYSLVSMLEWYTMEATLIEIFFYTTLGLKIGNYT